MRKLSSATMKSLAQIDRATLAAVQGAGAVAVGWSITGGIDGGSPPAADSMDNVGSGSGLRPAVEVMVAVGVGNL